jgi:hypothetical protein
MVIDNWANLRQSFIPALHYFSLGLPNIAPSLYPVQPFLRTAWMDGQKKDPDLQ